MGPVLSKNSKSESITFMRNFIYGKYRLGAPNLFFNFVDVRDVAKAHILAFENNKALGRFIIANKTVNIRELSDLIRKKYSKKYKLPLMNAPKFMMYIVAPFFGLTYKYISRNIGYFIDFDNSKSKKILGLEYTNFEQTIFDMLETI
jgi:nucleoside-diphosphate-sugar epimerase